MFTYMEEKIKLSEGKELNITQDRLLLSLNIKAPTLIFIHNKDLYKL